MAAELGAARISVGLDTSKVAGEIKRAFAGVDADGSAAGKAAGNGFAGGFKGIVGPAIAAVGAIGFGGLIAEAARASDATDKFKSTMNFAGLDTSAIEAATAAAKGYADATVYELSDIQKTMATLAANGVEDYTGITTAAGNLNAVAGGNAETFKSVSLALGQSAGAGKLMAEDWNMLADAIPGASGQLQDAMREAGAFEGNFKKAMEAGEISAEEFQAAITKLGSDPIAVEAARSVSTFEGALGNLSATVNSGLMGALDAMKPAITGAINLLSNGLGAAFEWTGQAATGLKDLFVNGDFTGALANAFNVEEDSGFVDFLFRIRDTAIDVANGFKTVWAGFKMPPDVAASFGANLNPLLAFGQGVQRIFDGFKTVWAGFKMPPEVAASFGDNLNPLLAFGQQVRNTFSQVGEALKPIGSALGQVFSSLGPQLAGTLPMLSPFGLVFQALLPVLPQVASLIAGLVAQLGPVLGGVLAQVTPLVGLLVSTLSGVFVAIMPAVTAMVVTLSGALAQIIPVVMGVIASIMPLVATLIGQLAPIITSLVTSILPPIVSIFGNIVNAIAPLVSQIAEFLIPIVEALLPVVVTVFSVVADVVKSAMQVVQGVIQAVTGAIRGDWSQVWTGIGNIFKGIWDTIVNVVRGALQIVGQVVISGISAVVNTVGSGLGQVTQFFQSLPARLVGALAGIGSMFVGVGRNIIQGLIDGASGMIGNAVQAVKNVGGAMLDGIKGFLGIHSPSRVFKAEVGMMIGAGVIAGVDASRRGVTAAVNSLVAVPSVPALSTPSYAPAGPSGSTLGGFPSSLRLVVDGHEFTAYVDGRAAGAVQAFDSNSQYRRAGR